MHQNIKFLKKPINIFCSAPGILAVKDYEKIQDFRNEIENLKSTGPCQTHETHAIFCLMVIWIYQIGIYQMKT